MLCYDDWHQLEQVTKSGGHSPSPVDEEATPKDQTKRIDYQINILRKVSPMTEPVLRKIALELRVSEANPKPPKFSEDGYRGAARRHCSLSVCT